MFNNKSTHFELFQLMLTWILFIENNDGKK